MEKLTDRVKDLAHCLGAVDVGIATTQTLAGGPPSTDLTYVLPGATSAVTFLVPMDQAHIEPYLGKKDRISHEKDNIRASTLASGISFEIANYLSNKGFASVGQTANLVYRIDTPNGVLDEKPPVSHRYLAVRSGIGWFGLSGNIVTKEYGAAVALGAMVTTAELVPSEPLPAEDNYCDGCRLCMAGCVSGYMSKNEKSVVTMGEMEFSYAKRKHHNRCDYVCGGFTGLHRSGKWSTWSPGRFPVPESDEEFIHAIIQSAGPYKKRPREAGGLYHFLMPGNRIAFTCCNCMLICHPDREVRKRRYKLLESSGVVIQRPDGSCEAVSPEKAAQHLAAMPSEQRALYEKT